MKSLDNSESSLKYLSLKQIRRLINYINNSRDKLMIRVLYETGCSLVELTEIKVKDVLGNKIRIKNSENNEIRFPRISGKLAKDIKLYILGNNLDKDSFLISTRQSESISEKRIRQIIQEYTKEVFSEKINPQSFRYFHIAHAYTNGVLLENISKQIGITTYRIFQILEELNLSTKQNYNKFLKKV